uniref:ATP-dependent DNA helicase n=1 Tax=Globodera rostochiensis TaxID=31243 RepID=A0A914IF13_GLORO
MNLALNPDNGDEPAYGQIFIVDTEQAMRAIEQANVAYLMKKEEENSELEKARREQREPAEIKLLFETGKQMDRRLGYNVPRANEVAAVYVPGADGEVPEAKIVVRQKGKELKILNSTDAMVTPMTYPLFYPAWMYPVENQGRGLPHIHLLLTLSEHDKLITGEQICYFDENMMEEEIRDKINNGSELLAYFELNKTNVLAKTLLYHQIPEKFCLKKGKWIERKAHFNTIGRMVKVSPAEPERYHLRLLLLHVKGASSYDELKTIRNLDGSVKVCTTFAEACLEKGLIRNDEEWKRALEEAESFEMPWKLRDFFALILVHCNPAKPEELWEMFKESLSEDFSRNFRQEIAYAKAYREIALSIKRAGKTLADFPSMQQINVDEDIEQAFNAAEELDQGERAFDLMYDEQKTVTDEILTRIRNPVKEPAFFFLSGPGGTGKTHVNKTIVHLLRGEKKKVSTMAFTGMAATLLPAGRTLHNRFGLSLDMGNSNISPRSKAWIELKETDLFICDEAPMINKRAMRTLDEKLKEIMNNDIAFGGKVMLWTGDFRQTLPIQKHATRSELVNSTIKRSEYWRTAKKYKLTKNMRALETEQKFAKDLLEIGTGKWNNENDEIILPEGCISNGDLAEEIFGNFIVSENWNEMAKSAILAPKNLDILTGDKAGQTVYIPRITLCCAEEYPFDLHRHQFPLVLAFAMTINKAQGQTLERTLAPPGELLEQRMRTMARTVDFRLWKGIASANKTKQDRAVGASEAQQHCHGLERLSPVTGGTRLIRNQPQLNRHVELLTFMYVEALHRKQPQLDRDVELLALYVEVLQREVYWPTNDIIFFRNDKFGDKHTVMMPPALSRDPHQIFSAIRCSAWQRHVTCCRSSCTYTSRHEETPASGCKFIFVV